MTALGEHIGSVQSIVTSSRQNDRSLAGRHLGEVKLNNSFWANLIGPTPNRAINCTKVTVREPWDTILRIRKPVAQWISKQPLRRCVMH